jgi:HAD superfamily hydrolase (TIGR01509 family)
MADHSRRLRGVIFDFGNTLIGLDPAFRSARTDYADVVARPGAERLAGFLARERALPAGGEAAFVERFLEVREGNRQRAEESGVEITAQESLRESLGATGRGAEDSLIRRAVEESFAPEKDAIVALPGAEETLSALRARGVPVALLSNATDGAYVAAVARKLGWRDWFDPFAVSADIGFRKPRPEAFRAVLDRWPVSPAETAMVGDSLRHDVGGARAFGLLTVHFTAIENPFDAACRDTVRADVTVRSHEELRARLIPLVA